MRYPLEATCTLTSFRLSWLFRHSPAFRMIHVVTTVVAHLFILDVVFAPVTLRITSTYRSGGCAVPTISLRLLIPSCRILRCNSLTALLTNIGPL
jgi:hypothetical protein